MPGYIFQQQGFSLMFLCSVSPCLSHWLSSHSSVMDRCGNTTSNSASTVVCIFTVTETCFNQLLCSNGCFCDTSLISQFWLLGFIWHRKSLLSFNHNSLIKWQLCEMSINNPVTYLMTTARVWIGIWVYCTLETHNYNSLKQFYVSTHLTNHFRLLCHLITFRIPQIPRFPCSMSPFPVLTGWSLPHN
jgi:hypothetical protein